MHPNHRPLAVLAASALGASLVFSATPAHAAPVFTDSATVLDVSGSSSTYSYVGPSDCLSVLAGAAEPDVPVVENGPAASASTTVTATYTNTSIPGDTATGSGSASATGKVTSVGGDLATMDLAVTSSSQMSNALGTSTECMRSMGVTIDLEFEFTVTHPGFVTLNAKNTGDAYADAYVYKYDAAAPGDTTPYIAVNGRMLHFNGTVRAYLPAGNYRGYLEGTSFKYAKTSYTLSGTSTMHAEFHVSGSQTEAVAGKGKKYVALPATRSCATHDLATAVTGKKKRAAQVKQITFLVNDVKVKKVKTPKKGAKISLPIADDQAADVVAQVELVSKTKGKPGKVVEVSSSYEACS